jgi:FlaA1/EpsC-like NDP-sugar epimerase
MRCDLGGKVALVTGAAGAIGSVIARRLSDNRAIFFSKTESSMQFVFKPGCPPS